MRSKTIWDEYFVEKSANLGSMNYDDVFIVPQYSDIVSRKEVDISNDKIKLIKINVPIMPANMYDIVNVKTALEISNAGGLGCLHRFSSIEESVKDYLQTRNHYKPIFMSIGVNRDSQERFTELYNEGARYFIIDIAHGHSKQMKNMIEWIKGNYSNTYLMAGNIATQKAVYDLVQWGADSIKIGIGPGGNCLTKNVTGVTIPQFSCIEKCATTKRQVEQLFGKPVCLVADGGFKEIGDVCKAIGAGADFCMSGKLFAGCEETPSYYSGKYSGSASKEIQTHYRLDKEYVPTPEGITTSIELKGSVKQVVSDIAGGLKSAYSYVGAKNTNEFHLNCTFGVRHNK